MGLHSLPKETLMRRIFLSLTMGALMAASTLLGLAAPDFPDASQLPARPELPGPGSRSRSVTVTGASRHVEDEA